MYILFNGFIMNNKDINWNKLLYLAICIAGIPFPFWFLIDVIINSLIIIRENDQKGIIWLILSQVKGIKIRILSARGSIIAPNLVFELYFDAINPSRKSEIPPIRIKNHAILLKFISKNIIIGIIKIILKEVMAFGILLLWRYLFNLFQFNISLTFINLNFINKYDKNQVLIIKNIINLFSNYF